MENNPKPLLTDPGDSMPLQMSAQGFLLVALDETRENRLSPRGLEALLAEYRVSGVAMCVYDHETKEWVRLTKDMLK